MNDLAIRNFWERLEDRIERIPFHTCWEWMGARISGGYAQVKIGGKPKLLHRLVYKAVNGEIPDGLFVCHRCNNKSCIRPSHLYLATGAQNTRDAKIDGLIERGNDRYNAKLTPEIVREIRSKIGSVSLKQMAAEYGVTDQAVWRAAKGINWAWLDGEAN